jgi:hypothetical protein
MPEHVFPLRGGDNDTYIIQAHALQETMKSTRPRITYDGPVVCYLIYDGWIGPHRLTLTYDGPISAFVDNPYLRRPNRGPCRFMITYVGCHWAVVGNHNL